MARARGPLGLLVVGGLYCRSRGVLTNVAGCDFVSGPPYGASRDAAPRREGHQSRRRSFVGPSRPHRGALSGRVTFCLHVGPDVGFCWLRVKFLETVSSARPSDFREISRKPVLFFVPRLKKSGIEYVILAKSSLLTLSGAQSRYGSGLVSYWRCTARDLSMIWKFCT